MNLLKGMKEKFRRNGLEPRTRFAPAPTGFLHMGHVLSAIYVWGIAEILEADVLLRIEDHDKNRSKTEYESAILQDLIWLGFPQKVSIEDFSKSEKFSRQSGRDEFYLDKLDYLKGKYHVYSCVCSRKDIEERTGKKDGEIPYDGFCRNKNRKSPENAENLRLEFLREEICFDDERFGKIEQRPYQQCGDLLLRDNKGNWTYHYASAVDDFLQGINLIIRGEDLLDSTARQIQLFRMMGRSDVPVYFHHPLLYEKNGEKLSKQTFSKSIDSMRKKGSDPGWILGEAAYLGGLIEKKINLKIEDIPGLLIRKYG